MLCREDSFAHQSASESPSGALQPGYLASDQLTDRRRDAACSSSSSCVASIARSIVRAKRGCCKFQRKSAESYGLHYKVPVCVERQRRELVMESTLPHSWAAGLGHTATVRSVARFNVL